MSPRSPSPHRAVRCRLPAAALAVLPGLVLGLAACEDPESARLALSVPEGHAWTVRLGLRHRLVQRPANRGGPASGTGIPGEGEANGPGDGSGRTDNADKADKADDADEGAIRFQLELDLVLRCRAEEVEDDGTARVAVTFAEVRHRQESPRGATVFDSREPPPPPEDGGAALPLEERAFGALVGQEVTVRIGPDGTVQDLEGGDLLLRRLVDSLARDEDIAPSPRRAALEAQIEEQFSAEALEEMLSHATYWLPGREVAEGESWDQRTEYEKGFPMVRASTCTLETLSEELATVVVRSRIRPHPDASLSAGEARLRLELEGSERGVVRIDRATGLVRRGEMRFRAEGTQQVEGVPGVDLPPVRLELEGTTTVRTEGPEPVPQNAGGGG